MDDLYTNDTVVLDSNENANTKPSDGMGKEVKNAVGYATFSTILANAIMIIVGRYIQLSSEELAAITPALVIIINGVTVIVKKYLDKQGI